MQYNTQYQHNIMLRSILVSPPDYLWMSKAFRHTPIKMVSYLSQSLMQASLDNRIQSGHWASIQALQLLLLTTQPLLKLTVMFTCWSVQWVSNNVTKTLIHLLCLSCLLNQFLIFYIWTDHRCAIIYQLHRTQLIYSKSCEVHVPQN